MEKAKGNTIGETKILMLTSKLRPAIKKKRSARLRNDECTIMAMIMFSNNDDDDNYHYDNGNVLMKLFYIMLEDLSKLNI